MKNRLPLLLIIAVWAIVFAYTFDRKPDLNGDNALYYTFATALAQGHGYSDISLRGHPASSTFPPGYPLLMTPLRVITQSIVAQKMLNGLFLLGACVLLFLFLRRQLRSQNLALVAAIAMLLNARVLEFATMMMSETSYLLFCALTLWLLFRYELSKERTWWKNPDFWLAVLCAAYAYHIRTQGAALVVALVVWFFAAGRWRQALAAIGGFGVLALPWMIRNHALGLGGSRYFGQIMAVNNHRPDAGMLSAEGLVERGFETLRMLLTKALPNTVTPYLQVDYATATSAGEWLAAIVLCGLIVLGFWQLRRYFWFLMALTIATLGMICLFNDPGGNRYLTTLVPFLEAGLVIGLYTLLATLWRRRVPRAKAAPSALWLLVPLFLLARGPLEARHQRAQAPYPPQFVNFFKVGEWARRNTPAGSVIANRKTALLWLYSRTYGSNYAWTADDVEVIRQLVENGADYVLLDQLGYSSTPLYLYPAIMKHRELFTPVYHLPDPDTYLLQFDRAGAAAKLGL